MELGLNNKVVLVTGASRGIGRAISEAFAREGAKVAMNARNQDELRRVAAELQATGAVVEPFPSDLSVASSAKEVVDRAAARLGPIQVLVNNVGGIGAFAPFEDLTDEDWLRIFELNVMSAVRATRAVLPYMQKLKWGRIINISSESGTQPDALMPHYNASKASMNNLTKSLSKAYARDGILVNTVSPAFILTPLVEDMLGKMAKQQGISREEARSQMLTQNRPHIELKRPGTSEEVAAAVVFLASERASFITGSNLRVDGGSVASI